MDAKDDEVKAFYPHFNFKSLQNAGAEAVLSGWPASMMPGASAGEVR